MKVDVILPTIAQEYLIVSLLHDANKVQKNIIFDFPGEYFNEGVLEDKAILLKFEDEFVDIMCDVFTMHIPN